MSLSSNLASDRYRDRVKVQIVDGLYMIWTVEMDRAHGT